MRRTASIPAGHVRSASEGRAQYDSFAQHYSAVGDDELLRLAAQKNSLREAANQALEMEMRKRGLGDDLIATREQKERQSFQHEVEERAARWKSRFAVVGFLATFFSGIIFSDWAISKIFNLPGNATDILTQISLDGGCAVAVLGVAFARPRLSLKTTLVTTAVFSGGLFLWILWLSSPLSAH